MGQRLRVFPALEEDPSSVLITHVTTAYNSSSRGPDTFLIFMGTCAHINNHIQIYT